MSENLQPNFKSEYWKYSPKLISDLSLDYSNEVDLNAARQIQVGLGSTTTQYQILNLSDLEAEGYLDFATTQTPLKLDHPEIKKANLDSEVSKILKNRLQIKFKKSLPSNLWIKTTKINFGIDFIFSGKRPQCIMLLEDSKQKTSEIKIKQFNFFAENLEDLQIGMSFENLDSSYNQINIFSKNKTDVQFYSLNKSPSYNRLEARLFQEEKESSSLVSGLSLASKESLFDYHSDIFQLNKSQKTIQNYNTINSDKGKSVFCGRIHLSTASAGAQIEQLNKNLLLGSKSNIDAQPELNIYNDDVKASHGSTTGSLNPAHYFYFESRGFTKAQARKMLLEAFAKSTLNELSPNLKNFFENEITSEI